MLLSSIYYEAKKANSSGVPGSGEDSSTVNQCQTNKIIGLCVPGPNVLRRHAELSVAITHFDEQRVEEILKPYYRLPEKPDQLLWSCCSLCHEIPRIFSPKQILFLMKQGYREIVWRVTPDFLDLGYIVTDSLLPQNYQFGVNSIEGALSLAMCIGSRDLIQKLIHAGVCINCLEACSKCFREPERDFCPCTQASGFFQTLCFRSYETEVHEILTTLVLQSGNFGPRRGNMVRNVYLNEAVWVGNFKAIKLLIEAGDDPTMKFRDGSTVVNLKIRTGFNDLEQTSAVILHVIMCHENYSSTAMDAIMFPGNMLHPTRWPTLEFMMRMIITALHGEWDRKYTDLVRIDVFKLFQAEEWMSYLPFKESMRDRKTQETAARILFQLIKFPSAIQELSSVTRDWVQHLFRITPQQHSHNCLNSGPPSLKESARFVIRRHLRPPIHRSLEQLTLPETVKEYLLMTEELKELVSVRKILNQLKENTV